MAVEPENENTPVNATEVTLESPCNVLGGFRDSMLGQVPAELVQLALAYWHDVTAES